jgi:hypothetical protein
LSIFTEAEKVEVVGIFEELLGEVGLGAGEGSIEVRD